MCRTSWRSVRKNCEELTREELERTAKGYHEKKSLKGLRRADT